jgi:hypothetical protein
MDPTTHNRLRVRQMHRFALAGVVLALVATLIMAVLGVSGTAGAAIFFLLSAFGFVVAALIGFGLAIVDEFRRHPVALKRAGIAIFYFAAAAVCIVATVGAASGVS